ncbi:hypothetical protein QC764_0044610 [Podospora pseudoanserina]|uniref:Uncharacterized protein n=1 Tax=Podospora pseudoanserina TaxID=2609844 RepID=A0ABR0IK28_9PEZI|nr:hypothetical protein QC764_0044610 [Podospora pseudoanserina]
MGLDWGTGSLAGWEIVTHKGDPGSCPLFRVLCYNKPSFPPSADLTFCFLSPSNQTNNPSSFDE